MANPIQIETIGTNRYAPAEASDIVLYAFNGVEDLTLAQLVMAVCIRQAALIERQSVVKMNEINESASWLSALALAGDRVCTAGSLDASLDLTSSGYVPRDGNLRTTLRRFLVDEARVDAAALPATIQAADDKVKVFSMIENLISNASTTNQEQMIDLQSLLSRRDSTYNMSASCVKKLGTTMTATAGNF